MLGLLRLGCLDARFPVFVESESKRIGALHVPDELMTALWASACVRVEMDPAVRVELLKAEYAHFLSDPEALYPRLGLLTPQHGRAVVARWMDMGQRGDWDTLVWELLERHYDPAYTRSIGAHYPQLSEARHVYIGSYSEDSFTAAARSLMGTPATTAA